MENYFAVPKILGGQKPDVKLNRVRRLPRTPCAGAPVCSTVKVVMIGPCDLCPRVSSTQFNGCFR